MALPATSPPARVRTIRSSGQRQRATDDRLRKPRTSLPWQERALAYYDLIGELHFASQFYARALSQLRLFPAYRNPEDGTLEPIESGTPVDLLERVQDPGGGGLCCSARTGS